MAKIDVYLNFDGNTEEAFEFYKSVFGGEFDDDIMRFGDMPAEEGSPKLTEQEKKMIMHIGLPLTEQTTLRGTDAIEAFGQKVNQGNNVMIHYVADSREETKRIFEGLSVGGKIEMPLEEQFWGDYFGSFIDKFGVLWNISTEAKE